MTATSTPDLCSVIVPCLGRVETARQCLAALLRHTRLPWELIAVNDGGKAVSLYLAGVQDAARVRVVVVEERGLDRIREAWHLGLRAAQGEYIALLGAENVSGTDSQNLPALCVNLGCIG